MSNQLRKLSIIWKTLFAVAIIAMGAILSYQSFHQSYQNTYQATLDRARIMLNISSGEEILPNGFEAYKNKHADHVDYKTLYSQEHALDHEAPSQDVAEDNATLSFDADDEETPEAIPNAPHNTTLDEHEQSQDTHSEGHSDQPHQSPLTQEPSLNESVDTPEAATEYPEGPKIAMLVTGLGLSKSTTERVLSMQSDIALGFSPYGYKIDDWIKKAVETNHDVLMHIPMEPLDYPASNEGPYSLMTDLGEDENIRRMRWALGKSKDIKGIYTTGQERFSLSEEDIRPILHDLAAQELYMVYGGAKGNKAITHMAELLKLRYVFSDHYIDDEISVAKIEDQLTKLEELALKNGDAVGIARPYPISVTVIERWIQTLPSKGITLVPITTLSELRH